MTGLDLDAITARCEAATPGEWETRDGGVTQDDWYVKMPAEHAPPNCTTSASMARADAEFIAASRTDVPALVAALRAVQDLHRPVPVATVGGTDQMCAKCRREPRRADDVTWPCATFLAAGGST